MKVPSCPKNLSHCKKQMCPEWRCWAFDKFEEQQEREKKQRNQGWE